MKRKKTHIRGLFGAICAVALSFSLTLAGAPFALAASEALGDEGSRDLALASNELDAALFQAVASAPLSADPKPAAGGLRADGLVFRVLSDGASVALCGWSKEKLPAAVVVPARVSSGADVFAVTALEGEGIFKDSGVESLSLPATMNDIAEGALSDCDTLSRLDVSPDNETYASFDGMLFSKDLSDLLLVPEGKEGAAHIPDSTATVPASALFRCARLLAVEAGEGCVSFSSRDGILYSKDMLTLVACPPGAANAVVIPQDVQSIGPGAFAGCTVSSITALGDVRDIAPDAFDEAALTATVALREGANRAVWETAGFSRFADVAQPGDTARPEPNAPDAPQGDQSNLPQAAFSYEVLPDYTLAVSWAGGEAPASLEVPATAEVGGVSYRVSAVAAEGFSGLGTLESVTLPASLTSLGTGAFAGCSSLAAVSLSDGLTTVGERAFEATALSEVWLPASVSSVGLRAFSACPSLTRVVALGTCEVASDALAECSGVSVYCPAGSQDAWDAGVAAAGAGITVLPYAASLATEPLALAAGDSASLLEGGELLAPTPVEAAYSYAAKPLSVDSDGVVTGKSEGATDVAVVLTLDGVELARASRSVEVAPGDGAAAVSAQVNETATLMPAAYFAGARVAATPISVTTPIAVVFGGSGYYDVSTQAASITAPVTFHNNSGFGMRISSLESVDDGASQVLQAKSGAAALDSQDVFSLYPTSNESKKVDFPIKGSASPTVGFFDVPAGSVLDCTYRLNLGYAEVKPEVADNGATVQGLAKVKYTFVIAQGMGTGTGSESASFYLKDNTTNQVYSLSEVKKHAEAISLGDAECKAAYEAFMADESKYTCKTTWGNVTYDVRVIGINHDDKVDGTGKAGLTFQFKNLLDGTYRMNADNNNTGCWGASELRRSLNEEGGPLWSTVPTDLQGAITPVKKAYSVTYNNDSAVTTSDDKLFIASYYELMGTPQGWSSALWIPSEGTQYEYYQSKSINVGNNEIFVKHCQSSSTTFIWWMRSVSPMYGGGFLGFDVNGNPMNRYDAGSSTTRSICPCFCL